MNTDGFGKIISVEEKYGREHSSSKRKQNPQEVEGDPLDSSDDSSDSEEEDDEGELATEALDLEINATLNAIRSKDPRVYDKDVSFYSKSTGSDIETTSDARSKASREKPMYLQDYHRQTLLNGSKAPLQEEQEAPLTYVQEQKALKQSLVNEVEAATAAAAAANSSENGEGRDNDDDFLTVKPKKKKEEVKEAKGVSVADVEQADQDPRAFLSNFMAARAWVPTERSQFQPFESDDEEEERKAEAFEEAYNLRFEDPATANEKLVSHARDTAVKYSVRREDHNPRKRKREAERTDKEAAKSEKVREVARLRKLKIKEAETKLREIKKAAGAGAARSLSTEEWARFLEDDWDGTKWEEEMQKRFDEQYYARDDVSSEEGNTEEKGDGTVSKMRKKPRKPKWDDDIDITDLVPDFENDQRQLPGIDEPTNSEERSLPTVETRGGRSLSKKDRKRQVEENKLAARQERQIVEEVVDRHLELQTAVPSHGNNSGMFRYRQSSPVTFGLSARDILMADDSQLNQFAGLKKLAPFRDPTKKRKDQKRLGKKARLRQWRKDTFGNEEGPALDENTRAIAADTNAGVYIDGGDLYNNARQKRKKKKKRHANSE